MKKLTEEQKLKKEHYHIGKTRYFLRICDFCGILYNGQGAQFCSKTCMRLDAPIVRNGDKNASWKGGVSECIDCNTKIKKYESERCRECWIKEVSNSYLHADNPMDRIYASVDWRTWRESVFKRDNYVCQECGDGGYVEPHHIIPVRELSVESEELFDIKNGITLCRPCHMLTFRKEELFAEKYSAMNSSIQQPVRVQ